MPLKDPAAQRVYNTQKMRAWRATKPEKAAYTSQKNSAIKRGIPFLLTIEEWTGIWLESGKWEMRGRRKGQYVMARYADSGTYEIGNIRICLASDNLREAWALKSDESRERIWAATRGKRHSEESRQRMSAGIKATWARKRAAHGVKSL